MARKTAKTTKATAARTHAAAKCGLFILRPPTLRNAQDVAKYLESEFAAVLRSTYDLAQTGSSCPFILLDDLAYVAESMARVLRGEGAMAFEDESCGFAADLSRSLREIAGRVDGDSYKGADGLGTLWPSTLPTLARLLGRAEAQAAREGGA